MGGWGSLRQALVGFCFALWACACASPPPAPEQTVQTSIQDYQLGSGDRLRIIVFDEADLTGEFVVGSDGTVSFPLVGAVPAQGQTVAEFTETLREAVTRYVLRPSISVEVLNFRPFFILGEVGNPGTYPYSSGLTVMNAVATAGGFGYRADTRRVFIKHQNEFAEREYQLNSTTPVSPGDTIRIPERRF